MNTPIKTGELPSLRNQQSALDAMVTIGSHPTIELGPITLAWHANTMAADIVVSGVLPTREAQRRNLDLRPLETTVLIVWPDGSSTVTGSNTTQAEPGPSTTPTG